MSARAHEWASGWSGTLASCWGTCFLEPYPLWSDSGQDNGWVVPLFPDNVPYLNVSAGQPQPHPAVLCYRQPHLARREEGARVASTAARLLPSLGDSSCLRGRFFSYLFLFIFMMATSVNKIQ